MTGPTRPTTTSRVRLGPGLPERTEPAFRSGFAGCFGKRYGVLYVILGEGELGEGKKKGRYRELAQEELNHVGRAQHWQRCRMTVAFGGAHLACAAPLDRYLPQSPVPWSRARRCPDFVGPLASDWLCLLGSVRLHHTLLHVSLILNDNNDDNNNDIQ